MTAKRKISDSVNRENLICNTNLTNWGWREAHAEIGNTEMAKKECKFC